VLVDRWQVGPDQADLLARLSEGRIGWAIAASQDQSILARRAEAMADLQKALTARRFERLEYAAALGAQRDDALYALDLWRVWWRDLLLTKLGTEDKAVNSDFLDDLRQWAKLFTIQQIREFLGRLIVAARRVEQDANVRLVLESLFLNLPSASQPAN